MLEIDHPATLAAGQKLGVGVNWSGREVVLQSNQFIPARVIRCLGHDGHQHVAIQFNEPVVLKATA